MRNDLAMRNMEFRGRVVVGPFERNLLPIVVL